MKRNKLVAFFLTLTIFIFGINSVNAEQKTFEQKRITLNTGEYFSRYYIHSGETSPKSDKNDIYFMTLTDDNGTSPSFCLEMGKPVLGGELKGSIPLKETLTSYIPDTYKITSTNQNGVSKEVNLSDAISILGYFGRKLYRQYEDSDKVKANQYYLATQLVMWEYLSSSNFYRNINNPVIASGNIDLWDNKSNKLYSQTSIINQYKNNSRYFIVNYYNSPAFDSSFNLSDLIDLSSITTWDDNKYTFNLELKDHLHILSAFEFDTSQSNTNGCSIDINDNTKIICPITITKTINGESTTYSVDSINFTLKRKTGDGSNNVYSKGNNYQTIYDYGSTPAFNKSYTITVSDEIENIYRIKVIKEDSNYNPVEGVKYKLCKDPELSDCIEQSTYNNGFIIFSSNDVSGKFSDNSTIASNTTYYLKEISSVVGLIKDDTTHEVKIDEHDLFTTITLTNNIIMGQIKVIKTDKDTSLPLEGVVFEIYNEANEVVDTITTDDSGIAISKELEYGSYYIKEKESLNNYILNEEINNIIIEENKIYELTITNEKSPQTGDISIILIITLGICSLAIAVITYIKKNQIAKNNAI